MRSDSVIVIGTVRTIAGVVGLIGIGEAVVVLIGVAVGIVPRRF